MKRRNCSAATGDLPAKGNFAGRPLLLLMVLINGFLAGCSPSDPALEEQTLLLEADLRKKDQRIEQLENQLAEVREKASSPEKAQPQPKLVSKDQAGKLLDAQAGVWRRSLSERVDGIEFTGHLIEGVAGPEQAQPFAGSLSVTFTLSDGRQGQLKLPVSGNALGEWQMPADQEVVGALRTLNQQQQSQARKEAAPAQPQQALPQDVMGANQTLVIEWGDSPAANPGQPNRAQAASPQPNPGQVQVQLQPEGTPPAPPNPSGPAPTPSSQPAKPKQVMPVDRDVIIDFD